MSNWITDRPPTEADADADGDVVVPMRHDSPFGTCLNWAHVAPFGTCLHWAHVAPGAPWRHTTLWHTTLWEEPVAAPEPAACATQPRRFVSISRTILKDGDHILDAIDEEGIAWWMRLDTQPHHPAFPPRDPEWQQLSPLPARELPTEPAF